MFVRGFVLLARLFVSGRPNNVGHLPYCCSSFPIFIVRLFTETFQYYFIDRNRLIGQSRYMLVTGVYQIIQVVVMLRVVAYMVIIDLPTSYVFCEGF